MIQYNTVNLLSVFYRYILQVHFTGTFYGYILRVFDIILNMTMQSIYLLSFYTGTHKLECIRPDGSGRETIYDLMNYPFSVTTFRDNFYWTDWQKYVSLCINIRLPLILYNFFCLVFSFSWLYRIRSCLCHQP